MIRERYASSCSKGGSFTKILHIAFEVLDYQSTQRKWSDASIECVTHVSCVYIRVNTLKRGKLEQITKNTMAQSDLNKQTKLKLIKESHHVVQMAVENPAIHVISPKTITKRALRIATLRFSKSCTNYPICNYVAMYLQLLLPKFYRHRAIGHTYSHKVFLVTHSHSYTVTHIDTHTHLNKTVKLYASLQGT